MKKFIVIAAALLLGASAWAQPKFAHVNFAELVQLMPEADQARTTLQASSKEAQDTYQSMMEEFNSKYSQYEQKVSTWTPAIKESKEKELTDIQQRIQQFQQSISQELQQQEQQLMALYNGTGTRAGLLAELTQMRGYLGDEDMSSTVHPSCT